MPYAEFVKIKYEASKNGSYIFNVKVALWDHLNYVSNMYIWITYCYN